MPEDLEVGVLLQPKNDLEDEVGTVEADTDFEGNGQAGGAGGMGGRAGIAILAGLLTVIASQLRSISALGSGVLNTISKLLAPIVAYIAQFLRPAINTILDALANFDISEAASEFLSNLVSNLQGLGQTIVSGFRNAVSQIPGVDVTEGEGGQQRGGGGGQQIEGGFSDMPQNIGQLGNLGSTSMFVADHFENVQTVASDLQDEEKKSVYAEFVNELVNELT